MRIVQTLGWLACVVYSTIPSFWFMVHPRPGYWRRHRSPFRIVGPTWILMWFVVGVITARWRTAAAYSSHWSWIPAAGLFLLGAYLYRHAGAHFSLAQVGGLPEVRANHRDDRLVTSGIRGHVRHPIYLAHLCEMFAWAFGTGLLVCWILTGFAIATGAVMIRMEDAELERRFGEEFRRYRDSVGAVLPRLRA